MASPTASEGDWAIRLDGVSVCYRAPRERVTSLKELAVRSLARPSQVDDVWALRDANVHVQPGQVVGVIGKNGAGKSTLLKVIARVLHPTGGRVRIAGAVAPLLEFGAGFHPELTGRENVFLNGTLLGFTRAQMQTKFKRIVDFAELWDFIDAPLRTYSSGMVARLGFAVATDVEPEILLLDEILSVGDTAFQNKCYERILSFRASGATILFVSHNMGVVKSLCERAIWLDRGRIVADGPAEAVVNDYLYGGEGASAQLSDSRLPPAEQRWGTRRVEITAVRIKNALGQEQFVFATGDALTLEIDYCAQEMIRTAAFGMGIHRQDGTHVTGPNTALSGFPLPSLQGSGTVTFSIPSLPILEGLYRISVSVHTPDSTEMYDLHDRCYPFRIVNAEGCREQYGLVTVRGEWSHVQRGP